jgi:hypothetical protein
VRRVLLPLLAIATIAFTGCADPGAASHVNADGSCDPTQLRVTVQERTDPDPELVAIDYILANNSNASCTLTGIPAVTIMRATTGEALGTAQPLNDDPPEVVRVDPHGTAYLFLWTLKAMDDTATCVGDYANSTRIVVTGSTDDSAIVSGSPVAKYCDEPARKTLLVSPFTSEPIEVPGVDEFVPLLF